MTRAKTAVLLLALAGLGAGKGPSVRWRVLREEAFTLARPSEVVVLLTAGCPGCAWGIAGREAAVLVVSVDGRYSQHVVLTRGEAAAEYRLSLGPLKPGEHRVEVALERVLTPPAIRDVSILRLHALSVPEDAREHTALSLAPILHARSGTLREKSDVPLLMWYETEQTSQGTKLRYSVVFTNEDGGTPADRLMATWGRLTDIEYVYGVELDAKGRIVSEEYQGREHKMLPFKGKREGRHPLLWVVTDNNMVSDLGTATERQALVPVAFPLQGVSREAVMDANPWTYAVSFEEARREGRIDPRASPGSGKLPEPRRFLFLEACGELRDATLAFDVGIARQNGVEWLASDGGLDKFRIARSGCFRGAVAVPEGAPGALQALRFRAYTRPSRNGEPALPKGAGSARLLRVNRLFALRADLTPGDDLFRWTGELDLVPDGPPAELPAGSASAR